MRDAGSRELLAVAVASLLMAALAFVPLGAAGLWFAFGYVLVVPGIAIVRAVFPAGAHDTRDPRRPDVSLARALLYAIPVGIAVSSLAALAATSVGVPFSRLSAALTLALLPLPFIVVAFARRISPRPAAAPRAPLRLPTSTKLAFVVCLGALLLTLSAVAYGVVMSRPPPFTEFSTPAAATGANQIDLHASPSANVSVEVWVRNHEHSTMRYSLAVRGTLAASNSSSPIPFSIVNQTSGTSSSLVLEDGATAARTLLFQAPQQPGLYRLDLQLTMGDGTDAYRTLQLWLFVT